MSRKELGLDAAKALLEAPVIPDYQEVRSFRVDEPIPAKPARGRLLFIKETK